ncbi:MAG: C-type lectin domain-containing protein, partial [Deltaproteobacteria bacterium]|nr:C-type lectin domain-containing protein [Deltaproteobacteria bacterium]
FTGALTLPTLLGATGAIRVEDGAGLTSLSLPAVTSLLELDIGVAPALTSIDLRALDTITTVFTSSTPALTSINVSSLTKLNGTLDVHAPLLTSLSFPKLRYAEWLWLPESLQSVDLPVLASANWIVAELTALTSLSFPALTTVKDFNVEGNPALATLTAPLLRKARSFSVAANAALPHCLGARLWTALDGPPIYPGLGPDDASCAAADQCIQIPFTGYANATLWLCGMGEARPDAEKVCQSFGSGAHLAYANNDEEWSAMKGARGNWILPWNVWLGYRLVGGVWSSPDAVPSYNPAMPPTPGSFWLYAPGPGTDATVFDDGNALAVQASQHAFRFGALCRVPAP